MSYEFEFGPKAEKVFNKLPAKIALTIVNKFKQVKQAPFRYLKHYEGDSCYKLRIGNYRALVDVHFEERKLVVRILDKRGRIYKR